MRAIDLPITTSPTRVRQGLGCFRRGAVLDVAGLGRRGAVEKYSAVGKVLHAGAAEWWRTGQLKAVQDEMEMEWAANEASLADQRREMFARLMQEYSRSAFLAGGHWARKLRGWQVVAIEERMAFERSPLGRLTFQLDRLVKHEELQALVLVDTKSKGRWSPRFERKWREEWVLDPQQMLYRWAVKERYGVNADHYIEALVKDEERPEVVYLELPRWSDSQLDEVWEQAVGLVQEYAEYAARATEPGTGLNLDRFLELVLTARYNPAYCEAFGSRCPLWDVCRAAPEERLGMVRSDFETVEQEFLE